MRTRTFVLCLAALCALASRAAGQSRLWNPDERITISSFGEVLAIAYDRRNVYAATPNGLEIYDAVARRWLMPSTLEDRYPMFERPVALAYDRSQGGLWLLAASGNVYLRSDLSGVWDMRAPFDVPRELIARRSAAESDPAWRVMRGTVTLDPAGRRWPVTAIADSEVPGIYWVGTAGGNIIRADTRTLSGEWLSFGTLSRGVNAIAVAADGGLWFGGDGLGPRQGITQADRDLQRWTSYESVAARAPRRNVNRILTGDTIWAAAADGVFLLPEGARSWRRIEERDGLPDDYVRSLERTSHGIWAGTSRGLALIDPAALRATWRGMEGARINGLAVRNDTLWIATDLGLWIATSDSSGMQVLEAPGRSELPWLKMRIMSVAYAAGSIAALVEDRLYVYDTAWNGPVLLQGGRRAHELRSTGESLLILRADGLEEYNPSKKESIFLSIPADIPDGPVRDAARAGEYIWVATPSGAVRLRTP